MTTQAINQPEKESYLLVEFRYGDPEDPYYARYTTYGQDTNGHAATPDMEVEVPTNTGTFGEAECKIEMPLDSFSEQVAGTYEHSKVYIKITEVTRSLEGGPAATNAVVFTGCLSRSVMNPEGRTNSVKLFFEPPKARLGVALGLPANHECTHNLFDSGCKLLRSVYARTGEIATIVGKKVTISANPSLTSPVSPGGNVDRYWERGYLQKDGLRIDVHQWKLSNPTEFILRSKPPPSWLLAGVSSITFVPGCHKSVEDCRQVWDNESEFMGFGYAIPAHNRLFEDQ